jgi:hypothetical protein
MTHQQKVKETGFPMMCTSALGKQVFIGGVCGAKNYADKKKGYAKNRFFFSFLSIFSLQKTYSLPKIPLSLLLASFFLSFCF